MIVSVSYKGSKSYYECVFDDGHIERFSDNDVWTLHGHSNLMTDSRPTDTITAITQHLDELRLRAIKDLA